MKDKWWLFLFVALVLLLTSWSVACSSSNDEVSTEKKLTQQLWEALMDYNCEIAVAEQIYKETGNRASELLGSGEITTREFSKRIYQATLIHAHTIKFIDSKPRYALLNTFMWHKTHEGKPPALAHCIPEFESDRERVEVKYEQYLEDYIAGHLIVVEEFSQVLIEKADELGIELTYIPKL